MERQGQTASLIVTSEGLEAQRRARRAIRSLLPEARIRGAGLKGIFFVEAEGDALELARRINQECAGTIGRATPVLIEVQSKAETVKEAAVRIGSEHIGPEDKFCFRLHKRGAHWLQQDTPALEREIGGAIWESLEKKHGKKPAVDLKNPDVMVVAEVLGPTTSVGIFRKGWRPERTPQP